jgi:hypothetical protein
MWIPGGGAGGFRLRIGPFKDCFSILPGIAKGSPSKSHAEDAEVFPLRAKPAKEETPGRR